jgi:hypothetical protein
MGRTFTGPTRQCPTGRWKNQMSLVHRHKSTPCPRRRGLLVEYVAITARVVCAATSLINAQFAGDTACLLSPWCGWVAMSCAAWEPLAHNVAHIAQGSLDTPGEVGSCRAQLGDAAAGPQGCPEPVSASPGCGRGPEHLTGIRGEAGRGWRGQRITRAFQRLHDPAKGVGGHPLKERLSVVVGAQLPRGASRCRRDPEIAQR